MATSNSLSSKLQNRLYLLPALRLVWQSGAKLTIARIALLILQGVLPLIAIYLSKLVVDTIAANLNSVNQEAAFRQVLLLLILAGVVTIIINFCSALTEIVETAQAEKVTNYMQSILHVKSTEVDLECYENPQYYDIQQRAQEEAPYRPTEILNRLTQVGQNGISLVAIVGLLLSLHWSLASILLIASLPAVVVRLKYAKMLHRWQHQWTPVERQADYLDWLLTEDTYAKEIRLFDLGNLFRQRFNAIQEKLYHSKMRLVKKRSFAYFLAQGSSGVALLVTYGLIINQTIQGSLQLGDLVLYHQAFQRGRNALKFLLVGLSGLYEDNLFLANVYEFLEFKPKIVTPQNPKPLPQKMEAGIVFHQVSFNYPNTNRQAIKEINLTIKPGETIALVGENGSGKTTLVKLLCRLYEPKVGRITLDGIDLREFATNDLRRQISVIFQDYAQYNLSAQENIGLGNLDLLTTPEKIKRAARHSGADSVIRNLPQGYDTILGKLFDQGEELSIGQWQKVALARAFLRDSQVIILDEPTSAMDPQAEYEVFQKFRQLIKHQAAVLISHRLSTVRMADCIYVMAQGEIVESGTHEKLMQLGGTYAHLFETQAQNYQ